ncbi:MAG: hypothetical protein R3A10_00175 [Caldilineaceae bacterium]
MRIGQVHVGQSIWRSAQGAGERFRALEESERAKALCLPRDGRASQPERISDQRMGVAMDGAIIPIREEGWKEIKIGNVFDGGLAAGSGER